MGYSFLKNGIIEPKINISTPVKLIASQGLVGNGTFIDISNPGEVWVIGLLLKPSVIEPVIIIEIVHQYLLLEVSSTFLQDKVFHVFTGSILFLEIQKHILQTFLFVLW